MNKPLVLLCLLLGFGVVIGAVLPFQKSITTLEQQETRLGNRQNTTFEQFQELEKQTTAVTTTQKDILKQVPKTPEQEQVLRDLQRIARAAGYQFTQVAFSTQQNRSLEAHELRANFTAEGPAEKMLAFLRAIENNQRFMGMETLNVQLSERGALPMASLSIALYALYQ